MKSTSFCFGFAAALFAAGLLAAPASATLIVVPNSTFDDPELVDGDFSDTTTFDLPDWQFDGGSNGVIFGGAWDPQNADYSGTTGDNVALPPTAAGGQTGYIYLEQFNDASPAAMGASFTTAASCFAPTPSW